MLYAQASGFPSPLFAPAQFDDGGGQAPALRLSRPPPFIVARGTVPRHRSGTRPPLLCRARAPALDPFGERALPNYRWVANRPRTPTIAGDRPPRYGCRGRLPSTVGRGPVPRHATIAGDRPPRYGGNDVSPSVGQERLLLIRSGAGAPELQNGHQPHVAHQSHHANGRCRISCHGPVIASVIP